MAPDGETRTLYKEDVSSRGNAMPVAPHSHRHTTMIQTNPADHRRIEQFIDNDPALKLLGTENCQPDEWTIHVGCASERVRSNFDHWVYRTF
jgi:hypothetical protein